MMASQEMSSSDLADNSWKEENQMDKFFSFSSQTTNSVNFYNLKKSNDTCDRMFLF